ncbi:hypothetical protein SAMN05216464_102147 [Mucilaginibacter pineti]|uniref:Uncharacterized protein n=1 Tax=Mucilaginibacter pineti TaxID=1391627 RepID=A0A1G6WDL0_9SPHI|nr:hypothetical protein SAMN05216464_102147 [Mucilaginibacter pineti]
MIGVVIIVIIKPRGATPIQPVAHFISEGSNIMKTITAVTDNTNPKRKQRNAKSANDKEQELFIRFAEKIA